MEEVLFHIFGYAPTAVLAPDLACSLAKKEFSQLVRLRAFAASFFPILVEQFEEQIKRLLIRSGPFQDHVAPAARGFGKTEMPCSPVIEATQILVSCQLLLGSVGPQVITTEEDMQSLNGLPPCENNRSFPS
jgi:hypothetical protein